MEIKTKYSIGDKFYIIETECLASSIKEHVITSINTNSFSKEGFSEEGIKVYYALNDSGYCNNSEEVLDNMARTKEELKKQLLKLF